MPGIPQLVAERMDGKRPGYRGDAAYSSRSEQSAPSRGGQGNVGSQSSFGDGAGDRGNNSITMEVLSPRNMPDYITANDIESIPTTIKAAPEIFNISNTYDPMKANILDQFLSYRPEVNVPSFMMGAKAFQPVLQKFSDISAEQNRAFFADPNYQFGIGPLKFGPDKSVLEVGRYQLPGELGEKYGKFGYEDIAEMTSEELDQAYKGYLKARSLGEIDAYGNPIMRGPGQDENPLQNLLLAQQLANPTAAPSENLQGGVAQLYNQYLRNLGYTV